MILQHTASSSSSCSSSPATKAIPPMMDGRVLVKRVAYLGLCFSLLFTGFNTCQVFVTTLFPAWFGSVALCLIYVFFALGSLLGPSVNALVEERLLVFSGNKLVGGEGGGSEGGVQATTSTGGEAKGRGEVVTMAVAGLSYVMFILAVACRSQTAVLLASCVKGLCSGLLWTSQGVWLSKTVAKPPGVTRDAPAVDGHGEQVSGEGDSGQGIIGLATGVFFMLYNLNGIVGSLLVVVLLQSGSNLTDMLVFLSVVSAVGTGMLLFAAATPSSPAEPPAPVQTSQDSVEVRLSEGSLIVDRLRGIARVSRQMHVAFLTPYLICQGVNMAYTFGNYPNFISYATHWQDANSTATTPAPGGGEVGNATRIATGFLLYGIGSVLGSFVWGSVYDRWRGRLTPLLLAHFLLVTSTFTLLLLCALAPQRLGTANNLFLALYGIGFSFGLTDFLTNAIINNSVTTHCAPQDVPLAFSWYRFCFCVGFAGASALSAIVPPVQEYLVLAAGHGWWTRYGWTCMVALNGLLALVSIGAGWALESRIRSRHRANLSCPDTRKSSDYILAIH